MLSLTKSLALLLLMAGSSVQLVRSACSDECVGCTSTSFSGDKTITSSACKSSQYAYVTNVHISSIDDTSIFTYKTVSKSGTPYTDTICSENVAGTCVSSPAQGADPASCGLDGNEDASVVITCKWADSQKCALEYGITWACADKTTNTTSSSTAEPTSATTTEPITTNTEPNDAWAPATASLISLGVMALAAILQV